VPSLPSSRVALLRQELIARNRSYATLNALPHVMSYGELAVVVYRQSEYGQYHGNFIPASYRAILREPRWRKRLEKVHAQGRRCLPTRDRPWHELDSSVSSDALLMNIFCYPRVTWRTDLCGVLGIEQGSHPEFGFRPHVPLLSGGIERTEIDMKLGNVLFEAKLTEADFQLQRAELVECYRDFRELFVGRQLPRIGKNYVSYQLIRNILAAYALDLDFCALIDARRPDLIEDWYAAVCCVRSAELRVRCKVLAWQELAGCLPAALRSFLNVKYGIIPAG
jgi:hypothetical protein